MAFARKPDGTLWCRICCDYRGLRVFAISLSRPAAELLPHIDALLDGTWGSRCFKLTKLNLASSYHKLRVLASNRWKTSFRSQLGQFELNVVPFGIPGSSSESLMMRVTNADDAGRLPLGHGTRSRAGG